MIVKIFEDISNALRHPFFDYVLDDEKDDIINSKNIHVAMFLEHDKEVFAAIIEILSDRVHVREVGGRFPGKIQWLEIYCTKLCDYFKIKNISFCTVRMGVKTIGKRLGFKQSKYPFEYEKAIA